MRTVRMFGRTVTQYETPMVVRINYGASETFEAPVRAYTIEQAEARGLTAFRKEHPAAVINGVLAELT